MGKYELRFRAFYSQIKQIFRISWYYAGIIHQEYNSQFPCLLTQLSRPGVGFFHLWGGNALGGHQESAQGNLQAQFLPGALRGIRQGIEQL